MSLMMIALAAAAAAPTAQPAIQTRTIGAHTPGRIDSQRCLWTATVSGSTHSGSTPGACHSDTRVIEAEIARRSDARQADL
ncbi:MAG: hypothetical protein QHC40_03615 [Sphingobium sp.]|nr:hypothetical protein [Sphingobium sp.]